MSSITIRNLDPAIKERLRVRAAEHGHSMEAEARRILQTALSASGRPPGRNLYERIHARFAPFGGVNLELPPREPAREPPRFDWYSLLDTNVLSAMMSAEPVREVAAWVSRQPAEHLFIASVCQAEILSGLAIMPEGRRRLDLEAASRAMFQEDFEGRVLPFDMAASVAYADIFAARRRAGRDGRSHDCVRRAIAGCQCRHPQCRWFRRVRRGYRQSMERDYPMIAVGRICFDPEAHHLDIHILHRPGMSNRALTRKLENPPEPLPARG